jgi:glycosyltransferase involved in cell wall biosynthesis
MNNKFKVLILNSDTDGVGFWRLLSPYSSFNNPDIQVDIRLLMDSTLPLHDENFLAQYKIIVYNKSIPFAQQAFKENFMNMLKKHNIKLVYDIDDYWVLSNAHPNYRMWKENNSQAVIEKQLMEADAVTTTTHFLADKIKQFNSNVLIVPNSVNLKEQQWISNKKPTEKIRFLWGGGITHLVDLRLLKKSFESLDKEFLNNSQFYLCGYDLRMNTPQGMKLDDPSRSTWNHFENIFTNNKKWINNSDYFSWLRTATDNGRDNYGVKEEFKNEYYQRRWTKPILLYGTMYNEADVVLAPLKNNNSFNLVKSQLKVVEAGAHHCPIVCSNYGPYTIDDIEGKLDGKQKGFLVDENEANSSIKWYECMKYYIDNPDKIKEHGENLFEYVRDNYEVNISNDKRIELFKKLIEQ